MSQPGSNDPLDLSQAEEYAAVAVRLIQQGRLEESIGYFDRALRIAPENPQYHHNRAVALFRQGRMAEAEEGFRRTISYGPGLIDPRSFLADLFQAQNRLTEAAAVLREIYSLEKETCRGQLQLARALISEGNIEGALNLVQQALAIDPSSTAALDTMANLLQRLGRFEESFEVLEKVVELEPENLPAYIQLARAKRLTEHDRPILERMISLADRSSTGRQDRSLAFYTIGKGLSDLGSHERAIEYFDRANSLMQEHANAMNQAFSRERHRLWVDRSIAAYKPAFFESATSAGNGSKKPVFVVGMIRSGTTLVEQILSNHSRIAAGGEMWFWLRNTLQSPTFVHGRLRPEEVRVLASEYLSLLESKGAGAIHVTDKMPLNFLCLGHIHSILPQAKIVHCRRHPVDTCVSIYTTPTAFLHQREDIAFYYRTYQQLMAHWKEVLPSKQLFELDYEDLVEDPETTVSDLIRFLNLDREEGLFDHSSNTGAIDTPSVWQARQPIYRSSVGRWTNFEPWLKEFGSLLGDGSPR